MLRKPQKKCYWLNKSYKKFLCFEIFQKKRSFDTHKEQFLVNILQNMTKPMDFISKRQGYIPLKVVPYIFFLAIVLSITTSTNTFV